LKSFTVHETRVFQTADGEDNKAKMAFKAKHFV